MCEDAAATTEPTSNHYLFRQLSSDGDPLTAWPSYQKLRERAEVDPQSVCMSLLAHSVCLHLNTRNMHDVMNLIHVAVESVDADVFSSSSFSSSSDNRPPSTTIQPSTASNLLLELCQGFSSVPAFNDRSCLWKAARGLLKHRVVLSPPCSDLRALLHLAISSRPENMSVHEQIQLLKTVRAMIDVLMMSEKSIMECCGRDLCHALLHPSVRAREHVQEWLGDMILLRKEGHSKGDVEEDVKQDQNMLLLLKKKRRRVAFAGDTDFNASLPSVEDDVDNSNSSGKYVRGPSRAQQKRRKASIQKWNEAYSSSDTTKKSFKS